MTKLAFSLTFVVVAVLHIQRVVEWDVIGLTLLILAAVPWASSWLESIKLGDFEAKFRELQESVDATRKELRQLKATYSEMEAEFLLACAKFDPEASSTQLNKLASELKAKAKGLASIDFIFSDLATTSDQSRAFGAACALQVRPQFHAIDGVVGLLDALSQSEDLNGFRPKTVYRLLMAVDEIVKLDSRTAEGLLSEQQRRDVGRVMRQIEVNMTCAPDDTSKIAARIAAKL